MVPIQSEHKQEKVFGSEENKKFSGEVTVFNWETSQKNWLEQSSWDQHKESKIHSK